jgi:hypothetical protein
MTRPQVDVDRVLALAGEGLSQAEISRLTGVSRYSVRQWIRDRPLRRSQNCQPCHLVAHNTAPA